MAGGWVRNGLESSFRMRARKDRRQGEFEWLEFASTCDT